MVAQCFSNEVMQCFMLWLIPYILIFSGIIIYLFLKYEKKLMKVATQKKVLLVILLLLLFMALALVQVPFLPCT